MDGSIASGLGTAFLMAIIFFFAAGFGLYFLIDWLFISDDIVTKMPLVPEIRITSLNGVYDTVYIYKNIK